MFMLPNCECGGLLNMDKNMMSIKDVNDLYIIIFYLFFMLKIILHNPY